MLLSPQIEIDDRHALAGLGEAGGDRQAHDPGADDDDAHAGLQARWKW